MGGRGGRENDKAPSGASHVGPARGPPSGAASSVWGSDVTAGGVLKRKRQRPSLARKGSQLIFALSLLGGGRPPVACRAGPRGRDGGGRETSGRRAPGVWCRSRHDPSTAVAPRRASPRAQGPGAARGAVRRVVPGRPAARGSNRRTLIL